MPFLAYNLLIFGTIAPVCQSVFIVRPGVAYFSLHVCLQYTGKVWLWTCLFSNNNADYLLGHISHKFNPTRVKGVGMPRPLWSFPVWVWNQLHNPSPALALAFALAWAGCALTCNSSHGSDLLSLSLSTQVSHLLTQLYSSPINLPIQLGSLWNFKLKLLCYKPIMPTCLFPI